MTKISNGTALTPKAIESIIYTIRDVQVMLDSDLAELYQVETRVLNQAVKRNSKRFPKEFMFQLSLEEYNFLKSQFVISKNDGLESQTVIPKENRGGRRKLPFVFTEQGVSMLSAVLRSDIAIETSIKIINAFVNMRKFISGNAVLFQRIENLEIKQFSTDNKLDNILKAIDSKQLNPKQGIFFNGQVFDAWVFISDLVKNATQSLILIDNYVDETVLSLFAKKKKGVTVDIFTKNISRALTEDAKKFNAQYRGLTLHKFNASHDRFLLIDKTEIYHIGASLKDLGKKWFAFSKMDKDSLMIFKKLGV